MINADGRNLKGNISVRKWCLIRQKVASDEERKNMVDWRKSAKVKSQRERAREGGR